MINADIAPGGSDDAVDVEISSCLDLAHPKSFFLYAGAGAGKTRSLVAAVRVAIARSGRQLRLRDQRIAVITYTNAAADEIMRRLEYDRLVEVSTIHSFAWKLISGFQSDIRDWLRTSIGQGLADLRARSSRPGTKAEADRVYRIERDEQRLASLDGIVRFVYDPNGDNRTRDSLSHAEVIAIAASFLGTKPLMATIFTSRYPFLFIDESQDTNAALVDALLAVQLVHTETFAIGLFGDTMQRIYNDGKTGIEALLPSNWVRPVKRMNHRSGRRIVGLINDIRATSDDHYQLAEAGNGDGVVRLFLAPGESANPSETEELAIHRMAEVTGDGDWEGSSNSGSPPAVKRLILEHHMAAARLGFAGLFAALSLLERERTALLDGSISGLQLFVRDVIPLMDAVESDDAFEIARIIRDRSPMLTKERVRVAGESEGGLQTLLANANDAVQSLAAKWAEGTDPSLRAVAEEAFRTNLFEIPVDVARVLETVDAGDVLVDAQGDESLEAWRAALALPLTEVRAYSNYVSGNSPFDTHQGVKGLEYPRVMVVISDVEARGFLFSYEKLFGAKALSKADLDNIANNQDTSIDRTRRLFYVTCSRAERGLAIVAYTNSPDTVQARLIEQGWFLPSEIELL